MDTVVITGASRGIGGAIAKYTSSLGYHVVATSRRIEDASEVVKDIHDGGGAASAMQLDVRDIADLERCASESYELNGNLYGWINNAGTSMMTPFLDVTEDQFDGTMDVNLKGVYFGIQAAGAIMKKQEYGRIVNISSMAAQVGKAKYLSDYVASKFAVNGLTQAAATELAEHDITVNAVCPGYVATPMQTREITWEAGLRGLVPEQVLDEYRSSTPLGRLSKPEDTAYAVGFLLSDKASFITGEALAVNGGAAMS